VLFVWSLLLFWEAFVLSLSCTLLFGQFYEFLNVILEITIDFVSNIWKTILKIIFYLSDFLITLLILYFWVYDEKERVSKFEIDIVKSLIGWTIGAVY